LDRIVKGLLAKNVHDGRRTMKKILILAVMAVFLFNASGHVYAAGTTAEAKAMVEKAVAFIKANGKDKAFPEFTDQKGHL
jgi:hypothetical protein